MRKILFLKKINSEKRRFLYYGTINFFLTTLVLQLMLLITETYFATLISQITNLIIGFSLYRKKVFKVEKYTIKTIFHYLILSLTLWIINWFSIYYITKLFMINRNIAAFLSIPFLIIISFIGQKKLVFKKRI